MKRFVLSVLLVGFSRVLFAQNEIGPEGKNLIWVLITGVVAVISFFIFRKGSKRNISGKRQIFSWERLNIKLEKDRMYYPDNLTLTVKNKGNSDIDMDRPLLVFDNFWLRRKFRLNGMDNQMLYPLYLEKGKSHILNIDLYRFYRHDKKLKKYPKVKITIFNVKGKRLGSKAVFLRKTLLKF